MGRLPKYTEKALKDKLLDYFGECDAKKLLPNKAGVCVFLGISRETYSEYRKKYPYAIKRTDNLIEEAWVQRLAGNAPTGAIFYLKNAFKEHYQDRRDTDITSGGKPIANITGMKIVDDTRKTD